MNELLKMTLVELTGYLRDRKASPVELMEAVLARIDETNPDLNTVVARRDKDELLAEAKASEELIVSGKARPLEGIPLGVKDLENVEGMITSMGSIPYRDNMAEQDSVQVARLKAAGAIVVGKTNTPEFGWVHGHHQESCFRRDPVALGPGKDPRRLQRGIGRGHGRLCPAPGHRQ